MSRSGHFVQQSSNYKAFIPSPLPPNPPIKMDQELVHLLSKADRTIGRLDVITQILPNPDLFISMYVRQEAVLSSQIEGTQSTLEDVLQYEINSEGYIQKTDVHDIVSYIAALNHGLSRLSSLPLSNRLLREIHQILLREGRGQHSNPGEFRESQNWIGPAGSTINTATFVPPPVHEMKESLGNLEKFLHQEELPILIQAGVAHAQFETIHPFLDGNGRIGRLLITLLLCEKKILEKPVLYLSHFFKQHRIEYYDRLMAVRQNGDWEGWIKFFLKGITTVGSEAVETTKQIISMREQHTKLITENLSGNIYAPRALDTLFEFPMTNSRLMEVNLGCAYKTANNLISEFEELGLLKEISGNKRNRRYRYSPYIELFPAYSEPPTISKERTIQST